jgi:hypothetical protein
MYFAGTAQPHIPAADGAPHETTHYTRDEKRTLADLLAARQLELPLVLDHAERYRAGRDTHNPTPAPARVGRVDGAMVDRDGNLIVIGHLQWDAPETRAVVQDVNARKVQYGLSLASTLERSDATVHSKRPDHVGLTPDPEYGHKGSWLHYGALTPDGLLPRLRDLMNEPGMYVPAATRANIEALLAARQQQDIILPPPTPGAAASAAPQLRLVTTTASRNMAETTTTVPMTDAAAAPAAVPVAAAPAAVPVAAAPAAVPAAALSAGGAGALNESQWREFQDVRRLVSERFAKLPPTVDIDELLKAADLQAGIDALLERAGITRLSQVPDEVRETLSELYKYQTHVKGLLKARATQDATQESDRLFLHKAADNPRQFRPALVSIAASHNTQYFTNQRLEEEKLQREVEAKKRAEEEKRREDEWQARKRALEEKEKELTAEPSAKRSRVQANGDGSVTLHTGAPAPAAAATTTTTTTTVTAARSASDRVHGVAAHWGAHLGPAAWMTPDVADPRLMADEYARTFQAGIQQHMLEVYRTRGVLPEYETDNMPRF